MGITMKSGISSENLAENVFVAVVRATTKPPEVHTHSQIADSKGGFPGEP